LLRCLYVDLDGTLFGRGASLLRDGEGAFTSIGVRALEACHRAGAEVVLYSGRRRAQVFEDARVIGSSSYVFEAGSGLVLDGELHWLTGELVPSDDATIFEQISALGAPQLLLDRYAGRLEYHEPWHVDREVSHLFRGLVDPSEAERALREAGIEGLRLVDNGTISFHPTLPDIEHPRAYHLIPAAASKARAVATHMRARGFAPEEVIAAGDSREDMGAAEAVGTFWLVRNALDRDPSLAADAARYGNVRVAEESFGAGVYEAVVTTLAERG
jgi:phosphoglycolate phosphatase